MKNKISYFTNLKVALTAVALCAICLSGNAQGNASKAQPLKKTCTAPAATSGNTTKLAPWKKQPIQSGKRKATAGVSTTQPAPWQAQPIQGKQ